MVLRMFMTLLSGFAVLLNRYTQQEDIINWVPVANRQHEASEGHYCFL